MRRRVAAVVCAFVARAALTFAAPRTHEVYSLNIINKDGGLVFHKDFIPIDNGTQFACAVACPNLFPKALSARGVELLVAVGVYALCSPPPLRVSMLRRLFTNRQANPWTI